MISKLKISNFKSSKDLEINIKGLTVLSGLNGSGKSTVLQALGLLKQSIELANAKAKLHFKGPIVNLGRWHDVLNESAQDDLISFNLLTTKGDYSIVAKSVDPLSYVADLKINDREKFPAGLLTELSNFQFIQADRISPAAYYSQSSHSPGKSWWLGCKGEYTVDYLSRHYALKVSPRRAFPKDAINVPTSLYKRVAPTKSLLDQTSGWLQHLSPGVTVRTDANDNADLVSLFFSYVGTEDVRGPNYRSSNVGFGLTYSLPIVVACLSATRGALLLLENPEAHLHPQGQVALGILLAKCAADGVQIIVETHSDHLLNGIRLAVKNELIGAEAVSLNYFQRDLDGEGSFVSCPRILADGQLSNWPEGFFDQWDKSLTSLLV